MITAFTLLFLGLSISATSTPGEVVLLQNILLRDAATGEVVDVTASAKIRSAELGEPIVVEIDRSAMW